MNFMFEKESRNNVYKLYDLRKRPSAQKKRQTFKPEFASLGIRESRSYSPKVVVRNRCGTLSLLLTVIRKARRMHTVCTETLVGQEKN